MYIIEFKDCGVFGRWHRRLPDHIYPTWGEARLALDDVAKTLDGGGIICRIRGSSVHSFAPRRVKDDA